MAKTLLAKSVVRSALMALAAGLCCTPLAGAPDPYTSELERSPVPDYYQREKNQRIAREQQEHYRLRVAIADAVGQDVPTAEAARRASRQSATTAPKPPAATWLEADRTVLLVIVLIVLAGCFLVRKYARGLLEALNEAFNPWVVTEPAAAGLLRTRVRAEEEGLSEFLAAFRAGPIAADLADSGNATLELPSVQAERLKAFYEKSGKTLETQRQLLQEADRSTDEGGRLKLLLALRWEMHALRGEAGLRELLPIWQMAFALEGLLKQLTDNAANVTLSTLRTLAGGIELLGELSSPGVEPDLLTRQPLRLLAVDDDPISRKAVAFALKRALNEPELAEDGEAALALTNHNPYDVVFLDVQMPGMDGFEVCTKIHESAANRNTPVVFVTGYSDFDARAKSSLSGGNDLIGKPFLTFEITVKALTLALRGRLLARERGAEAAAEAASRPVGHRAGDSASSFVAGGGSTDCAQTSHSFARVDKAADLDGEAKRVANVFLTRASSHLAPLREAFQAIFQAADDAARQDLLADVFLRVHSFTPRNGLPALHPALKLSAVLEGLLRKLLEQPQHATASTLFTLATGVELLDELCTLGTQPNLLSHPPVRLLVVDDDPVSRRAMTVALQMAFGKPECAESGDQALALASQRRYDVIFLDVQMPGMDGFEACSQVRNTAANRFTPVVFVTGHSDAKSRSQMSASGGSDFVGKPFLTSVITLKALIFALRGRLESARAATPAAAPVPAGCN